VTRKAIPESEKRKTLAFTLQGKDIERLDKFVKHFNDSTGYEVMTRQTFLEGTVKEKLRAIERAAKE
jgi:hypothetical protein